MDSSPSILIEPPPRERWGEAIHLALSHLPPAEQVRVTESFLTSRGARPGISPFAGLRVARQGDHYLGATWGVLQPGRTALVYQPRLLPDAPAELRPRLYAALHEFLLAHQVNLAQELLPATADEDAAVARSAGYTLETDLRYLLAEANTFPDTAPTGDLEFAPYTPGDERRLVELLERTYQGTLDCPELNGVRSTIDTIEGYRCTGEFHPDRWRIVRKGDTDVGCVLTTIHPPSTAELIYMGLVPEARGRGWGARLVDWTLWQARNHACAVVSVAVDGRNGPAIRTYERAHFAEFDRRRAMLRTNLSRLFTRPATVFPSA